MKKIIKKNQVIITALAVMIAAAGYISYSDTKTKTTKTALEIEEGLDDIQDEEYNEIETAAQSSQVLEDIDSLEEDLLEENGELSSEVPGEAILTGAATYMAQAKVGREQIRSQNKEMLLEIINNSELSETERQDAVATMVDMTDMVEKEAAAELLLEAKGFSDVVVNLTGETADIVVPTASLEDSQRAQIEDIVSRKTGIVPEDIVITPMNQEITE